ncbi:sel1 repeat family protein [Chitiniphilus eburneus]|uniref:Sel1 repeat family protein n=1 Tax=Chitiniphilus eburneus TaxID=2571148 RepID=A0A4U0PWL2_9NEIS|nr:sel1 repeat family protein [Chitiniphilus eburneus]TJZ72943.1 sel1 repeat family protein [Chitiniphilus eburneus]
MKRIASLMLLCAAGAFASEGMVERAVESRNFDLAFAVARADVADGSATDYTRLVLAQLYLQGQGGERDPAAAEALLRPVAAKGSAEAQFLLAGALMARSAEQMMGPDGKLDRTKLKAHAAKPASQRPLEREAAEWMLKSAQQGQERAVNIIVTELGNLASGLPSAERAKWFEAGGKPEWAEAVRMGESLPSLRQRREALFDPAVQDVLRKQAHTAECDDENISLSTTRIDGTVHGADYLVLQLEQPMNYTLLAGTWHETWTATACDKSFSVGLNFKADGLGGVTFTVDSPPEE